MRLDAGRGAEALNVFPEKGLEALTGAMIYGRDKQGHFILVPDADETSGTKIGGMQN